MFDNFLSEGSITSILLMEYAAVMMFAAAKFYVSDPNYLISPLILKSNFFTVAMIGSIPCMFWPSIYIGLYDGLLAGFISWFGFQLLGTFLIGLLFKINRSTISFHIIASVFAYPAGYYLSYSTLEL